MRSKLILGVVLGFLTLPAHAKEARDPTWVSHPPWGAFGSKVRQSLGTSAPSFARVVMACHVEDDGAMSGCHIIRETPSGLGLGDILLAQAPEFRRLPPTKKSPREISIIAGIVPGGAPADWLRKPRPEEIYSVIPTEALKRGIDGRAAINCTINEQGGLVDCVTLEEFPEGMGFGAAAIALSNQFLMRPPNLDGRPVQGVVSIPIQFITFGPMNPAGGYKRVVPSTLAWAEAPSFADIASAYPEKARARKIGGRATLVCEMSEEGRLVRCNIASSEPQGMGFDNAARAVAKKFAYPILSEGDRKATHDISVHIVVTFEPGVLDPTADPVVGKPLWAATPSAEAMQAASALVHTTEPVVARLRCRVEPAGRLSDCRLVSESITGTGAGAAALSLVPTFRLSTWSAEGLPVVGGHITLPLKFEPPPPGAPAK